MLKIYVAGKVSKDSVFGTHDWRDNFCDELSRLSGIKLDNLDPTKSKVNQNDKKLIFGCDSYMISTCDVLIVYLSDDISVGGSQEILIAKYYKKPVIGLAPYGGKFNGADKEYFGKVVKNYKDPFVFSTCDLICRDIEEVGDALKNIDKIDVKDLNVISEAVSYFLSSKAKPYKASPTRP